MSLGNWYTLFQVNWNCISRLNVLQLDQRFIDCIKRLVSPGLGLLSGGNLGLRYVAIKTRVSLGDVDFDMQKNCMSDTERSLIFDWPRKLEDRTEKRKNADTDSAQALCHKSFLKTF